MKKRIIVFFLSLAMILSMAPATFVYATGEPAGDLNAAAFFEWLSQQTDQSTEVRNSAAVAARMLRNTMTAADNAAATKIHNDDGNGNDVFYSAFPKKSYSEIIGYTHIGAEGDATSWDNFKYAVQLAELGNTYRAKENLAALKISPVMMAMGEINANFQSSVKVNGNESIAHSNAFYGLENVAMNSGGKATTGSYPDPVFREEDPYDGWYTEEKNNYVSNNGGETGHYLTLTDRNNGFKCKTTGFGYINSTSHSTSQQNGYTFYWTISTEKYSQTFGSSNCYAGGSDGISIADFNTLIDRYENGGSGGGSCQTEGHAWGAPTYVWSDDNSTCTATRICSKDASHVETETVAVTAEITKPATCTEKGETTYTATFENEAFTVQPKVLEDVDIDMDAHDWGEGTVTKEPTLDEEGERTFECSRCGATKTEPIDKLTPEPEPEPGSDPNQKGKDGTAVGPGASAACAEKAITSCSSDEGPAGTKFATLALKSTKQGNTNIVLSWTKVKGAKKYVIYGNACGKKNKMKKIATSTGASYNVKKAGAKLAKGKYYKFIVVALDANNNVVSTSKVVHVATKGGKVKNPTKVDVKKAVINKAKKIKKGKTLKLGAKQVGKGVKKHRALVYESSNPKIATVSNKGVVKGKAKGTCYIYVYCQNGLYKKIKVVVK